MQIQRVVLMGLGAVAAFGAAMAARAAPPVSQTAEFITSDAAPGDSFGISVGLSGDTAVAGAYISRTNLRGSAYVFTRAGSSWTQTATLAPGDAAADYNSFGMSVAAGTDTAVVGAGGKGGGQGAAYVFARSGAVWTQQAKLVAPDPGTNSTDYFDTVVALDGDTAVIGAPYKAITTLYEGAIYVFARSGATWTQQAKLTAHDHMGRDFFGAAVAVAGDTAVAGAYGKDNNRGAAYVYSRTGTVWTPQAELIAADGFGNDYFGKSVATDGDTVVVGAPQGSDRGAAYVFVRDGSAWSQQAKLAAADAAVGDAFGSSVAVRGGRAVVGASARNGKQGAVYVFTRTGTVWTQQAEFTAADTAPADAFGTSVALDGETAIVSAPGKSAAQGTAYVFTGLPSPPPPPIPPLAAPDLGTPSVVSATEIDVAWTDADADLTGFEIQRSDDGGATFAQAGTAPADARTFADTTLKPDRTVAYRVRGDRADGPSPWSAAVSATSASTFALTVRRGGKLVDSARPRRDAFSVGGPATPGPFAPAAAFDPAVDSVTISFGGSASPETFTIPAGDKGWRTRGSRHAWKSPKHAAPVRAFAIDFVRGRFSFSQSRFDFAVKPANPIEFVFHTDRDGATSRTDWAAPPKLKSQ